MMSHSENHGTSGQGAGHKRQVQRSGSATRWMWMWLKLGFSSIGGMLGDRRAMSGELFTM